MLIYVITNRLSGKQYVGQTRQPLEKRFRHHAWASTFKTNMPIACAIKKYGIENFTLEVVQTCASQEEMDSAEAEWMSKLNTLVPNGYNLSQRKGNGGVHETTKQKIAHALVGRTVTPETRRRLSESHLGVKQSEATRQKLREHYKGRQVAIPVYTTIKYYLRNPQGEKLAVANMAQFCRDNGHNKAKLSKLVNGKLLVYKGWSLWPTN